MLDEIEVDTVLYVKSESDDDHAFFLVTSNADSGTYHTLGVTYLSSSGGFADAEDIFLAFDIRGLVYPWQGAWVLTTVYAVNDCVENDGSGYVCIVGHTASATDEPGTGASWETYWDLLVEGGTDGVKGDTGVTGDQGDTGVAGAVGNLASITLEYPTNAEDKTIFYTTVAITITEIQAVVKGSSPSVTIDPYHTLSRDTISNDILTTPTAITNTTDGQTLTSFSDATVPADSFIILETTAVSGTVEELSVTLKYTVD